MKDLRSGVGHKEDLDLNALQCVYVCVRVCECVITQVLIAVEAC